MSLLSCRGLEVRIGTRVLVDGLDWEANPGQLWCVLGPNGIGKSTLLHTAAGLLVPAAGSVELKRKTLDRWPLAALARIRGLMAQQQTDVFSASVLSTVLVGRTPHRLGLGPLDPAWDRVVDIAAADAALSAVGMHKYRQADVLQLSGGERQRVALATLLAQDPDLMLLDEPTSHQDVAQQQTVMRLLRELSSRHAVILTTHDVNLAARFATHVLLLSSRGHVAGATESVLTPEQLEHAFGCRFRITATSTHPVFIVQ